MPQIQSSSYSSRPFYLISPHFETVIPSLFYKAPDVNYQRQRLELDDGDFLDLDWLKGNGERCMIITHGLEGSSDRYYVKRTAKFFNELGWDILAWNCRSCSGEMNRLPRFYHHGDTADLSTVIEQVFDKAFNDIVFFGYSMGGSMSLKYLGEQSKLDPRIKGAVTFSVPCNLKDSAEEIHKSSNRFYEKRFLKKVVDKMKVKALTMPEIAIDDIDLITDFDSFHERYTVPLHGFKSLNEFYTKATCDQFIGNINVPSLIVNAKNDPMLGDKCYPNDLAKESEFVYLEQPKLGGHVGFSLRKNQYSWMEFRAKEFIDQIIFPL